jgi:hypothetical protein
MPVASGKWAPEGKFYEGPVPANDNEPESRATPGENDRRYDGNASGPRVYAYVNDDPINATDPSGMCDDDDCDDTQTINVTSTVDHGDVGGGVNGLTSGGSGQGGMFEVHVTATKLPKPTLMPFTSIAGLSTGSSGGAGTQGAPDDSCKGGGSSSGQAPGAGGAAGQALNETGMPTVAKPGGIAGGGASGSVTSPASPILRELTGGAKFAPLRLIFPTESIGGAIGRTIPVIGTIGIYLDYLDYLNSLGQNQTCPPAI